MMSGQLRNVGTLRLAQAIHCKISQRASLPEACYFLLDLITLLFGADAASIELPMGLISMSTRWPESFFKANLAIGEQPQIEQIAIQHPIGHSSQIDLTLYYCQTSPIIGPDESALLDFSVACLVPFVRDATFASCKTAALTKMEYKVLSLLKLPTSAILEKLCISHETFRVHLRHIYKKLGVHARLDAIIIAERAGVFIG